MKVSCVKFKFKKYKLKWLRSPFGDLGFFLYKNSFLKVTSVFSPVTFAVLYITLAFTSMVFGQVILTTHTYLKREGDIMKIKGLLLIFILVILTGCSKIEELTEDLATVKNTYSEVKDEVEKYTDETIEDLGAFGEYEATEFISRNEESIAGGYFTDYYSSASFEEVVKHYNSILANSEEYEITQYPDINYTEISGMVDGAFLRLSISQDDEEDTYVFYEYESSSTLASENSYESDTSVSIDYVEAFQEFHDNQVEIFEGDPNIIIREEIGELDFQEIQEDWDIVGYSQNVYMSLDIKSTGEEGTLTSTADVFIKGKNINMTIYTEYGNLEAIYNAERNKTHYKNSAAVGSETDTGCTLPFRLLDLSDFKYMEESHDYVPQYIEDPRDGSRSALIWFFEGDTWGFISYDFDRRIIEAYNENGVEMIYNDTYPNGKEFPYEHHWNADEIRTDVEINDEIFNW